MLQIKGGLRHLMLTSISPPSPRHDTFAYICMSLDILGIDLGLL